MLRLLLYCEKTKETMMIIENQGLPHAGELFRFSVTGATGKTRINLYVNTTHIFEGECPDPPCHEIVGVPVGTGGSVLWIKAEDLHGNSIGREFTIVEAEANAGGMMSAE
jgi:hypothetical protein